MIATARKALEAQEKVNWELIQRANEEELTRTPNNWIAWENLEELGRDTLKLKGNVKSFAIGDSKYSVDDCIAKKEEFKALASPAK